MQLGQYQLVAEIARGGMGIVYLAALRGPAGFNKLVVVKALNPELGEDPSFVDMFLEEARLAARLGHRNIVQTLEVATVGGRHFMVMDYLEGVTLSRIVRRQLPRFTTAMHLRVLCEILEGLHYAHTLADYDGRPLGVVHRDATPQNVFVTYDGEAKLLDFGIAKGVDSRLETTTGMFKGKPAYMAPEQIAGDADPRADVFTVGIMVWEAVAGRRMWKSTGTSDIEILTAMSLGRLPSIIDAAPGVPSALVEICTRALARAREDRFQSALEMKHAIEDHLVASGSNVTMQAVGEVVAEGFADERARLRMFAETNLAHLAVGAAPAVLPSVLGHGPSELPASRSSISLGPLPVTDPSAPPAPPPIPVGRLLAFGGLIALAGVVLGGGALLARTRTLRVAPRPEISATTSAAPVPVPTSVAPPEEPPTITHEVGLRVLPPGATISIDGTEVSNPVRKLCKHGKAFVMHAAAAGHVAVNRTFACEADETLEVALVPAARGAHPPAVWRRTASPARAPAAPRPPEIARDGGTQPHRNIDPVNPYLR